MAIVVSTEPTSATTSDRALETGHVDKQQEHKPKEPGQTGLMQKINFLFLVSLVFLVADQRILSLPCRSGILEPNNGRLAVSFASTPISQTTPPSPDREQHNRRRDNGNDVNERSEHRKDVQKHDNDDKHGIERVVFLLSMGERAAATKIVERFVTSVRRRGNWTGPVVLLSDAPDERYAQLVHDDVDFFVMKPRSQDFNWNTSKTMPYKRFKTMALEYIDREPRYESVDLVYYLDVDIVVGSSLLGFFEYIEKEYVYNADVSRTDTLSSEQPSHPSQIYFFKENGHSECPVQGGQIVLKRRESQKCLEDWRRNIDSHPELSKDQKALRTMWERMVNEQDSGKVPGCTIVGMEQKPHLYFPTEELMQDTLKTRDYKTLYHITNTRRAKLFDERLQHRFLTKVLNLTHAESAKLGIAEKMIYGKTHGT